MFEDQQSNQSAPPANLPTEPADMFAGVEPDAGTPAPTAPQAPNAIEAGVLKPKVPTVSPGATPAAPLNVETPPVATVYTMKEPILGKIVMLVIIVVVVGGLGYGAYYAYGKFIKKPVAINETPVTPMQNNTTNENAIPADEITPAEGVPEVTETTTTGTVTEPNDISAKMNNDEILFGEPVDSDKDNLDDIREQELGTNPNDPDTDKDTLIDGDEVTIWYTNPLNPDTDADSFLDGVEVSNGYNPTGPGKIFNTPAVSTSSVANP